MEHKYDFGILNALELEDAAAKLVFGSEPFYHQGRPYEECILESGDYQALGVLGQAPRMRGASMAMLAKEMIEEFNLPWIILTGIAAGVPQPSKPKDHVRLGDIVVADNVIKFDEVKIKDGEREHVGDIPVPGKELLDCARALISDFIARREKPWQIHIDRVVDQNDLFRRPDADQDASFRLDETEAVAQHPDQPLRIPGIPMPHRGPIGTSAALVKDAKFRNQLASKHGLLAIEMEAGGIVEAAWDGAIQFFIVQGVCDYGDRDKKDVWQYYAALASTAFTRAVLEKWLLFQNRAERRETALGPLEDPPQIVSQLPGNVDGSNMSYPSNADTPANTSEPLDTNDTSVSSKSPPESDALPNSETTYSDGPENRGVFGRSRDIAKLAHMLDEKPLVVVYGLPGIGKTTVLGELRHTSQHEHRIYSPVQVFPDTTFNDLYRQLARMLGDHREVPEPPSKLFQQRNFEELGKYSAHAQPMLIHLSQAHHLWKADQGFRDPEFGDLLRAIADYVPKARLVLESRLAPPKDLVPDISGSMRIKGLSRNAVSAYFRRPLPNQPETGWELSEDDSNYIYERLGGQHKSGQAHPLAMFLLVSLAHALEEHPGQILKRYSQQLLNDIQKELFNELYRRVLGEAERRMLRICATYREDIPDPHVDRLNKLFGESPVFERLVARCLLTPDDRQERYYLHSLIAELTLNYTSQGDEEWAENNEAVADAWLSQIGGSTRPSQPNIRAASEAVYHLTRAGCLERLVEVRPQMLREDTVRYLDNVSQTLFKDRQYRQNQYVLELLIALDDTNHKYRRFLGETFERLHGRGDAKALEHYRIARELDPTYPAYLANLGRCLRARKEPAEFVQIVKQLAPDIYLKVMDSQNRSIYSDCLADMGDVSGASRLRREQIEQGARNAAFYNDEAKYLLGQGEYDEALGVLDRAEHLGIADSYTLSVRTSVLHEKGDVSGASRLRREQIEQGARHAAFYNDEAKYLLGQGEYDEALGVLDRAEHLGIADSYTLSVRTSVLHEKGDVSGASRLRREQIEQGARHAAFYNDEAKYLLGQGEYDEALGVLDRAEHLGIADSYTLSVRTSVLHEKGDVSGASRLRREQIEQGARNAAFYSDEAKYLLGQGEYDEALGVLDRAEHLGIADSYTLSVRTSVLHEKGDVSGASRLRREQIEQGARHAAFYSDEAKYLLGQGEYDEALGVLDRAEHLGIADSYTLSVRTSVLHEKGDVSGASRLRREQIEQGARNAAFYSDEAKYLLGQGEYDEALGVLDRAEHLGIADSYTLSVRTSVLHEKGDVSGASRLRREQIEQGARHAAFYNDEAKYLLGQGEYDEALGVLDRAEHLGIADSYTLSIRTSVLHEKGDGGA